jgi:hypothetical protein
MNSGSSYASSPSPVTRLSASCSPKLTALCAYSRPVQDIAEYARSAPRFGSSYCRRSLHHLQVGSDALARDRLDRRGRYPEEFTLDDPGPSAPKTADARAGFRSRRRISCMSEVIGAFLRAKCVTAPCHGPGFSRVSSGSRRTGAGTATRRRPLLFYLFLLRRPLSPDDGIIRTPFAPLYALANPYFGHIGPNTALNVSKALFPFLQPFCPLCHLPYPSGASV